MVFWGPVIILIIVAIGWTTDKFRRAVGDTDAEFGTDGNGILVMGLLMLWWGFFSKYIITVYCNWALIKMTKTF
jgi:hypothetical protein